MTTIKIPNSQLLENIFLQSTNVIAITNADFNNLYFEYVNPAFLKMTGYSSSEVLGKSPQLLQGPKTKRVMTKKLKEHCLEGKAFYGDNINYKKDGTTYQVEWTVTPIRDENNIIVNYLSIQKDITKLKELEEELIQNERLNALESLSSGLTHEINTSVTICKANLEMMGYDIEDLDNDKSQKYLMENLTKIDSNLENISYITNSLNYLTEHNLKIADDHNIYDILIEAIESYKDKIQKVTNCTLNEVFIIDLITLKEEFITKVNKKSLKHVFMIIIDNALDELVKHNDISLNHLDITIKQESTYLQIDFTDNAGGIALEKQQTIFEPLVKDKVLGGLGMGLYIAKNIISQHEGTIDVISNKSTTTFSIKLKY